MFNLLLINLAYKASDGEIGEWIKSRGQAVKSIRVFRDVVTGISPAFGQVQLKAGIALTDAINLLERCSGESIQMAEPV